MIETLQRASYSFPEICEQSLWSFSRVRVGRRGSVEQLDLIDQLDLNLILRIYRQMDARGEKAYDPRMMVVVLLLYGYCVGLPSSRKIEKACSEDLAFRVLSGNQQLDHTRISEFRRKLLQIIEGLFVQVLQLCQKEGLVKLGQD
ncbi:MAG: transposase [Cyanobacteria bacterium]|nr:transposase [Cyanobacteriota bacterium]